MLHTATVHPDTLGILRTVMHSPVFQQFNLVGGTSLSLQIGHRISIDLDLFTYTAYDPTIIIDALAPLGQLDILINKPPFLQVRLNDVKMDFLKFPYNFINNYVEIDGVRLVPIEYISIMKLLAIARRGVKKDFYDFYFILKKYTFSEVIAFFEEVLPNVELFQIIKSLTYFGDAEPDPDPVMLIPVTWEEVKAEITIQTQKYLRG